MGLDFVELIMAVEEDFDIAVPDEAAEDLRTPGMLKAFVAEQVRIGQAPACLSQRAFYRLRRSIKERFPEGPPIIRPSTLWVEILPDVNRRQNWRALAEASGLRLPSLVRPGWVSLAICLLAGGTSIALLAGLGGSASSVFYSVLGLLLTSSLGLVLTEPVATRVRFECATVGKAAEFASRGRPAVLMYENEGWNTAEISEAIDELIAEQLGISRTEFTDESDFVKDLGVD